MNDNSQESGRFIFIANAACLDFVNTEVMSSSGRTDLLDDFGDLVAWLRAAGLVDASEAGDARRRWEETEAGARAVDGARRFRRALRTAAERLVAGAGVGDDAIAAINEILERPAHVTTLSRQDGKLVRRDRWRFAEATDVLAPVAESARDLLCDGDLSLVRKCRNPDCILFFYDTTKNHGRAWCSMSACGNRTKVAAHYRRRRAAT